MYSRLKRRAKKTVEERIRSRRYTPFFILGQERTGSSLLREAMHHCPHVHMENEIFNPGDRGFNSDLGFGTDLDFGTDFESICEGYLRRHRISVRAVGCKIFYTHLTDDEWEKFLALRDFKIVHLLRRNRLRCYVSLLIAEKTNTWYENQSQATLALDERRVQIDHRELLRFIHKSRAHEARASERLRHSDVLEIHYEDLVTDLETSVLAALEHVGAGTEWNGELVSLRRQNPEPLSNLIINYEELRHRYTDTPWHRYFDE